MRRKVLGHLFNSHAPVKLKLPLKASDIAWMWQWQQACRLDVYLANRTRLQRLAFYSRERLHQITAELQLEYDRSTGYMVMLRSEKERQLAQPGLQLLRDSGVKFREVDAAEARRLEPAINTDTQFLGAIHLPDDEVANCRQFALMLKNEAQRLGVRFEFQLSVKPLSAAAPKELAFGGDAPTQRFDAIVMCAGLASADLLRPLGVKIPLAAVYGYSVSAPIREPLNAPRSGIMDERYKVAISRLGQRVRVAGSAEIGGSPEAHSPGALRTLYKVLHDWFPGAAQLSSGVQEWKGARPMLPDGPPIVGASGVPGVWLNLGHGSSGWALSCGSARAMADLLAGRSPEVDMEGLGISRFAR